MDKEQTYEYLVHFIIQAVESEQDEPREFSDETEKRLKMVFIKLRETLGLPKLQ